MNTAERVDTLRKSLISRAENADQVSGEHHRAALRTARMLANDPGSWGEPINERRLKALKHHESACDSYADEAARLYELARRAANVYRARINRLNTGQPRGFSYHVKRTR